MTKNIEIETDKSKTKKKKDYIPENVCKRPETIAKHLEDFTQIKNVQEANILIPHCTLIKNINKKDKCLREGGYFIRVVNNCLLLRNGSSIWKISFDTNKIYAKLSAQEDAEKVFFVNFLQSKIEKKEFRLVYNNKTLSWVELLEIYSKTI